MLKLLEKGLTRVQVSFKISFYIVSMLTLPAVLYDLLQID